MSDNKTSAEILIVDNSDTNWKVLNYLREWTEISKQFDIAAAYFEIGSLEDIKHYGKIVVALAETTRLMAEIDEAIEAHDGFPLVGSQT